MLVGSQVGQLEVVDGVLGGEDCVVVVVLVPQDLQVVLLVERGRLELKFGEEGLDIDVGAYLVLLELFLAEVLVHVVFLLLLSNDALDEAGR